MVDTTALAKRLDKLVGGLDYPMFIVTVADGDGRRAGCLIGFAAQCSIAPPRFMVWLSKKNYTYTVACGADSLAVHVPSSANRALAALFGTLTGFEVDKFDRCSWHEGPGGEPLLDDCPNWFTGRIVQRHDTGDHEGLLLAPTAVSDDIRLPRQLGFQDVRDLPAGNDA
jgi:flavin reductase (DIM6/NTAB) family NADH-FMN oxidoreductase RutF